MRSGIALLLTALAACASAKPGSGIASAPEVPIGNTQLRLRPGDGPAVIGIAFPIDRVWRALPAAFDSLGIPTDQLDAARHVIGNSGFKVHKRLGTVPLSKYIDCGSTQGFPSADEYDVNLSVLTQLTTEPTGATTIATKVEAGGRPMAFPGEYTRCSTKGLLETRIAEVIARQLER